MDVVITEWALQSYLNLKYRNMFTSNEYWSVIRPDVELLRDEFPRNPKFKSRGFWGLATDKSGNPITDGYKMKWHNIGPGKVQLRVSVAILQGRAFLCEAYVKDSDAKDKRECAKLKRRINQIVAGQYQYRGTI
jgi:hypothetical protein